MTQIVELLFPSYHDKMRYVSLQTSSRRGRARTAVALSALLSIHLFSAPLLRADTATQKSAPAENTPAGDIVSLSGTVYLRGDGHGASSAQIRVAKQGDPVFVQDIINTGSDGKIKVLMRDKTIIDLGPSALFKVEDYKGKPGATDREVEVSMVYGTMRAAVTQKLQGKGKFKVRTPSATMGVRGTEFVVKSEIHDLKEMNGIIHRSSGTLPPSHLADGTSSSASTQVSVLQGQVDVGKKDFNASAASAGRMPASSGVVSLTAGTQITSGVNGASLSAPKTMDSSQMKALSSEAKVVDTTFQKAVVIENSSTSNSSSGKSGEASRSPASGGSRSPSSAAIPSEALHQVLANADVPLPPPPQVKPADLNIPGALGPTQIFNQPAINTQGTQKRLRIVITTN